MGLLLPCQQSLRPNLIHGTVTVIVDTVTDIHIDTDMDTGEERDPLMPNQKLMPHQKLMPKLSHGTDMVDTTVDTTDTHTDTDMDTTEESDLPMPKPHQLLKQKLKLSHGTATVDTTATHTDMDMDTDTGVKSFLQCYQEHIIPQLKYLPFAFGKSKYFLEIV